jgi:hypothetical protein
MKKNEAESWSGARKFRVVPESASLSEYCGRRDLRVEQIQRWRRNFVQANFQGDVGVEGPPPGEEATGAGVTK